MLVRVMNGTLKPKDKIKLMATDSVQLVEDVGIFAPRSLSLPQLSAGQVGFIIAGIKELKVAKVGDTVTLANRPAPAPLPGFKEVQPQVFAGLLTILPFDLGVSMDYFGIITRKRHQLSPGADAMLLALRDVAANIYPDYRPPAHP